MGEPLKIHCELVGVRKRKRAFVFIRKITTGTVEQADLLVCELFGVVVTGSASAKKKRPMQEERAWQTVGGWTASAHEGLSFAMLTGDFNPIHWIGPYARHFGFDNTILHGFASLSRTYEVLRQNAEEDIPYLPRINVRFTRPLVLPNKAKSWFKKETRPKSNWSIRRVWCAWSATIRFQNLQDPIRSALVPMTSGSSYSAKSRSLHRVRPLCQNRFL